MTMINMFKLGDILLSAKINLHQLMLKRRADARVVEMIRDDFHEALRAQGRRLTVAQKRRLVQDILQGYVEDKVARQKIVAVLNSIYLELLQDKRILPVHMAQSYLLPEIAKDLLEDMLEKLSSNKLYVTRDYLSYIPTKFSGKKS